MKTIKDILAMGYVEHHSSYTRGYISRKSIVEDLPVCEYREVKNRKFKNCDYRVYKPCFKSTQFCIVTYYYKTN